jgi:hypothetical protein
MAVYNTASDAANTAVRAFLTAVGEHYYGASFNTGIGKGKAVWLQIQEEFGNACAYCEQQDRLQIEHLVMFNRKEYGLHHPGNIVPVCKRCNERSKDASKNYMSWPAHLAEKSGGEDSDTYIARRNKIEAHIRRYKYPVLSQQERHAVAVIAESLYENIKAEADKSLRMYERLDRVFVKKEL